LGALLLFRPIGSVSPSAPVVAVNPVVMLVVAGAVAAILLFAVPAVVRARRMKKTDRQTVLVGAIGTARSDLAPQGIIHVEGEDWSAVAEGGLISAGQPAQVVRIEGLRLVVRPAPASEVVPSAQSSA